ncbi:putative membrane protein insertion efficiency factor [Clostridia bacterium]|nr:putative membrane protein insertion efficiency factor [Clostridia bacterium]
MKRHAIPLALIDFYRRNVSPLKPPCCRFVPTCSAYAREAILRHGAIRGMILASYRLLRCNPLCKSGYDPVPEKFLGHTGENL